MKGLLTVFTCYLLIISLWTSIYGIKYYQVLNEVYAEKFDISEIERHVVEPEESEGGNTYRVTYYLPPASVATVRDDVFDDEVQLISNNTAIVEINSDGDLHTLGEGSAVVSVIGSSRIDQINVVVSDDFETFEELNLLQYKKVCTVLAKMKEKTHLVESMNGLIYIPDKEVMSTLRVTSEGDCESSSTLRIEGNLMDAYTLHFVKQLFIRISNQSWKQLENQFYQDEIGRMYFQDFCLTYTKKLTDFSMIICFH